MNVVVIDDTPVMLLRLQRLVQSFLDCRVIPFSCALNALAWCATNQPDLLIVDYLLPDMSGLDFVERVRRLPRNTDVPVIIVTQDHDRALRRLALQIGVNDFLTKPFDQAELQARVRNMLTLRRRHKELAAHTAALADDVARAAKHVRLREYEALECLACAAEHRDPETHEHILRLSHYAALIARELGLPSSECELLLQAARLHDVGKLAIPESILLKQGGLEPEEMQIMRTHTSHGHRILADSSSAILRAGAEIALCHHERFDGSGYPVGLQAEAIPLYARIVAVADVFDALTTRRSYKDALEVEDAADAIRQGAGADFDPACVAAFSRAWQEVLEVKTRYAESGDSAEYQANAR